MRDKLVYFDDFCMDKIWIILGNLMAAYWKLYPDYIQELSINAHFIDQSLKGLANHWTFLGCFLDI